LREEWEPGTHSGNGAGISKTREISVRLWQKKTFEKYPLVTLKRRQENKI
jgi:hypothetical protein